MLFNKFSNNKTVLITGSSRGIGAAAAKLLAQEGWNVIVNYEKDEHSANKVFAEVLEYSPSSLLIQADIRSEEAVSRMFDEAEAKFGMVDCLVNNAGIASYALFQDIGEAEWKDIFDVNVHGAYRCTRRALKKMISAKRGRIVSISSIWGVTGSAMEVHYSATKGAIIAMNKALAKELGPSGITVNTIAPGGVDTDMLSGFTEGELRDFCDTLPISRLARPEEVASLISYLLSDAAAYITGEVININGGGHI